MISIDEVSRSFGRVRALDRVSLRIEDGERVAFVGANGSGKTTLLRAVLGLISVDGRVSIDGHDVARAPAEALAEVAYIPQIAPPLESPVRELISTVIGLRGDKMTRAAVVAAAAALGVDIAAIERSRMRDLSGGTKQKLLAALALASPARVLVCDEPTANLDAAARRAFFEEIEGRPRGGVLILCSHRVEEVRRLVDRVIELRDGRVIADAAAEDLLGKRQTCRAEVILHDAQGPAARFLTSLGFRRTGVRQLGATLSQSERLDIIGRLLAQHGAEVRDLTLSEEEERAELTVLRGGKP
jgi:ABC-type multidrug transport system ATPase subunit